jgi:hypothetical protein
MSACPRCGKENRCGFGGAQPCWCTSVEGARLPVPTPHDAASCYCPECLAALAADPGPHDHFTSSTGTGER